MLDRAKGPDKLSDSEQTLLVEAATFAHQNFWVSDKRVFEKMPLTVVGGLSACIPDQRDALLNRAEDYVKALFVLEAISQEAVVLHDLLQAFVSFLKQPSQGTRAMQSLVRENVDLVKQVLSRASSDR